VPRISDEVALCSIYLYPSEQDAKAGTDTGGSGFLVHVNSTNPYFCHLYAVTNKHVIDAGCTVIRMNLKAGGIDTVPTIRSKWYEHPSGDDVVVLPIDISDSFNYWSVGTDTFIGPEIIDAYRLGYGDEAYLIGRLITHEGRQKNAPVIRFGNISLMADPDEPITCNGRTQEGFLVECRSLSGFSGSPVFAMTSQTYSYGNIKKIDRLNGIDRDNPPLGEAKVTPLSMTMTNAGHWLLGIDWGHVPLWKTVFRRLPKHAPSEKTKLEKTDLRVEQNTGIACVLPAWRIMDVLNNSELEMKRKEEDERIADLRPPFITTEDAAVDDVAPEERVEFTRADFEAALRKAGRKITPDKT
jgi:hypothetical protein